MIKRISVIVLLSLVLLSTLVASPPSWSPITGTEYSMILNAAIQLDGETFSREGENIAAAFGPGGESDCRSIGIWYPSTINYDGFWFFTIVANTNGEEIIFKIYDEVSDGIFVTEYSIQFEINATIGIPSNPENMLFFDFIPPQNVTLTKFSGFYVISWSPVPEAQSYCVYSSDTPDVNASSTFEARTPGTSWADFGALLSKKFYAVIASTEP